EGDLAGLLNRGLVDRDNGVRRFDVNTADVRTGHHDGFEGLALLIGIARGLRLGGSERARASGHTNQCQAYSRRKLIRVESHYTLQRQVVQQIRDKDSVHGITNTGPPKTFGSG